ncbi:PREDICTED: porphobilinogen deaminase [Papilio xuthus]|uniref:hydroxymethylbilane synthase n=1 Tax=Papilio xuthus TaxID=66420 RepID=A0AAJ6ZT42_PAPXU|nr:PREDICTED: porphobilinogen deaminase [Papilio xuthus]
MESEKTNVIRVGSRKSELALIQTNFVIDSLKKVYPDKEFTIVSMTTLGDRILNVSLPKIGEKSLFTKDLEDALRNDSVDFVVHSLKDLPTTLPEGLAIGAVFEREDPRDALVLREELNTHTLSTLPAGSVIGTSSLRRTAQLRGSYPQLSVIDVRGNLNTRLKKLDAPSKEYSALLLANAGLQRMGWGNRVSKILPCSEIMYAVGQGALAVECRSDNEDILKMLAPFNHAETYCRVLAERSFLKTLGGGCSAPVGVSTKLKHEDPQYKFTIDGAVWSMDGTTKIHETLELVLPQIKKTQKHKLSPTEETDCKKLKKEENGAPKGLDAVLELNRRITERESNLNCKDTRLMEEIASLKCPIFCGLSENSNIPIDVIEKCENLGKELANNLISKGALDVMKVTQDYIRSAAAQKS